MVRTLKEAIILSQLRDKPKTTGEIAATIGIGKSHVSRSLNEMKRLGLVRGSRAYFITNKGLDSFDKTCAQISGKRF